MKRQPQIILIAATLGFSWLAMQAVHELGHVAAAVVSGGRVVRVVLHPATISFTQLAANPRPLFVAWMGPIVGVALPVLILIAARALHWRGWYLIQFFAGYCLIANGAYLSFGALGHVGDAGDLLRLGAPVWLLWMFGVVTIPVGLCLWNGLGPYFGLGANSGQVDRAAAFVMVTCFVLVATVELVFSSFAISP